MSAIRGQCESATRLGIRNDRDRPDGRSSASEILRTGCANLKNIEPRCHAQGIDKHVVRTRMFVVDILSIGKGRARTWEVFSDIRPATAMVEVPRLIDPQMLVEIEADAYIV